MPTPKKPTRTAARIAKLEAIIREREERIFALEREVSKTRDVANAWQEEARQYCLDATFWREHLAEARALLREWRADFYATPVGERLRATERVLRAGVSVDEPNPAPTEPHE